MNTMEYLQSAETQTTGDSQDVATEPAEQGQAQEQSIEPAEETTPVVAERKENRGLERRIDQLTAKYKGEIEELHSQIAQMREPVQEAASNDLETVDDLKKYLLDELRKEVATEFSGLTKKQQEERVMNERQSLVESFSEKVFSKYSGLFDDGEFIGTDAQLGSMQDMVGTFNDNPTKWSRWIETHGIEKFHQFVTGQFETVDKKTQIDKVLNVAERTKLAKSSDAAVEEKTVVPKFTRAMDFLNFHNKGG